MNKHLIIFATEDYIIAKDSLIKSCASYFDCIHAFSTKDIDEEFFNKNHDILTQKRGAGYFLWKPYFIDKMLNALEDDDLIFYVDTCNIFINDPSVLYKYMDLNNGIILFDNRDGMTNGEAAQNFISCKKDCFVLMDCDEEEFINGPHLNASYLIFKNNELSRSFVAEWLHYCQNKEILTDTHNKFGSNYPGYYDHRHDQSVLSLLAIKYKIKPIVDPSEWGNACGIREYPQIFLHHRRKNYS